jgi:hypothetical protein
MTPGSRFAILEVANQPRSDPNVTEPSQWTRGASPTHQPARQAESRRFASPQIEYNGHFPFLVWTLLVPTVNSVLALFNPLSPNLILAVACFENSRTTVPRLDD